MARFGVRVLFLLLLSFSAGCNLFSPSTSPQAGIDRMVKAQFPEGKDAYNRGPDDYVATAKKAMVSSGGEPASEIALDFIKRGGNAVDAAIALSFAISVFRPQSTGIGGGGFMIIYREQGQKITVVDMRERAPKKATRDMYLDPDGEVSKTKSRWGGLAVATPGLVAGLYEVYQKEASKKFTWKELVEPSVKLAREGFPVYPHLAKAIRWAEKKELLNQYSGAKKLLTREDGTPLEVGDTYKNEGLANTLQSIADNGAKGFYEGWVANEIVNSVRKSGGILSLADLKAYKTKYPKPIVGEFNGSRVISMPPPSSGGVHIVQMLNMANVLKDKIGGFEDPQSLHVKAEIMRRAFADRSKFLGDPDFFDVPVKGLMAQSYARKLANEIKDTASKSIEETNPGDPNAYEKTETTHFSVVDDQGIAVSSTQTVNYYFGSMLIGGKTGIFLNDEMDDFSAKPGVPNLFGLIGGEANAIAPFKTPLSSMTPTIVTNQEGKVTLVLGSPGGSRIITSVWNVLFNVLGHGMNLRDAMFAPRIHHQWLPDTLQVEEQGFDTRTLTALEKKGHKLKRRTDFGLGNVSAISVDPASQTITGVADPRGGGSAKGF